jgi:hypothetical protein
MRQAASPPHGAEQALSGWRRPEQRGRMLGMRTTPDPYGGFRFPATNALKKCSPRPDYKCTWMRSSPDQGKHQADASKSCWTRNPSPE